MVFLRFIPFLLAAILCGCMNPAIAKMKKAEKASLAKTAQANRPDYVPQEKTMAERWMHTDPREREVHSMYDGKPYTGGGKLSLREYHGTEFNGPKAAPIKTFYSKSFIGTSGAYGSQDKEFSTQASGMANKSETKDKSSFNSKKYDEAERAFINKPDDTKLVNRTFATRSASVEGATSKKQLKTESQSLQQKINNGDLTIDQVRDLLNKTK